MSSLSNGGTAGAVLGLGFGLVEYLIVLRVIGRALSREIGSQTPDRAAVDGVRRKMWPIKIALLVAAFVVYPVVGYVAGNMIAT